MTAHELTHHDRSTVTDPEGECIDLTAPPDRSARRTSVRRRSDSTRSTVSWPAPRLRAKLPRPDKLPLLTVSDILAAAAIVAAFHLRRPVALGAVLAVLVLCAGGHQRPRLTHSSLDDLPWTVCRLLAAETIAAFVLSQIYRVDVDPLVPAFASIVVAVAVGRVLSYSALRWFHRNGIACHPTLILGCGVVGQRLASTLLHHPEHGLEPVGFVDDYPLPTTDDLLVPVLGRLENLPDLVHDRCIEDVIVAFSASPYPELVAAIRRCERLPCEFLLVPRLFDLYASTSHDDMVRGLPLVRIRRATFRGWQLVAKRTFDIVFSLVALILFAPVMAACALAVYLEDGRGVLFHQERVGRDGMPFDILKFRSLRPATHAEASATWNVSADPRIGRVGRFLRKTSLDELPQLYNILKGEMSFVGPRPERPFFVSQFMERFPLYHARHRVQCGLTGWAQIHGLRGNTSIEERTLFDDYYIQNWSLWLDAKILMRTAAQVLRGSGS